MSSLTKTTISKSGDLLLYDVSKGRPLSCCHGFCSVFAICDWHETVVLPRIDTIHREQNTQLTTLFPMKETSMPSTKPRGAVVAFLRLTCLTKDTLHQDNAGVWTNIFDTKIMQVSDQILYTKIMQMSDQILYTKIMQVSEQILYTKIMQVSDQTYSTPR